MTGGVVAAVVPQIGVTARPINMLPILVCVACPVHGSRRITVFNNASLLLRMIRRKCTTCSQRPWPSWQREHPGTLQLSHPGPYLSSHQTHRFSPNTRPRIAAHGFSPPPLSLLMYKLYVIHGGCVALRRHAWHWLCVSQQYAILPPPSTVRTNPSSLAECSLMYTYE